MSMHQKQVFLTGLEQKLFLRLVSVYRKANPRMPERDLLVKLLREKANKLWPDEFSDGLHLTEIQLMQVA